MMPQHELRRLLGFQYAKRHSPTQAKRVTSRRSAKSARNATGQKFLKGGRIVPGVGLEKLFLERK
jgi:hypothetical protein